LSTFASPLSFSFTFFPDSKPSVPLAEVKRLKMILLLDDSPQIYNVVEVYVYYTYQKVVIWKTMKLENQRT
jgi:hypothetical protein